MLILHLDNGTSIRLDPRNDADLHSLDLVSLQKRIRRVAISDGDGKRVDMPLNKNGVYRMWIELIEKGNEIRGERFCMRNDLLIMKATLYYSDSRVVFDLDLSGGFRCFRQETCR